MNIFFDKFKDAKLNGYNIGACVRVECEGKFLLVMRSESDFNGGIFEVPGGTLDNGESLEQTAIRELFEESGIVASEHDLVPLDMFEFYNSETGKHKVKFAFSLVLQSLPLIVLSKDHSKYVWLTKSEIESLPRQGVDEEFVLWRHHYTVLMIN